MRALASAPSGSGTSSIAPCSKRSVTLSFTSQTLARSALLSSTSLQPCEPRQQQPGHHLRTSPYASVHIRTPSYLQPATQCLRLPTTHCLLLTAYYLLLTPATYYLLPTTYYLPPTTYYLLPTAYYLLPTTYCLLPTAYYLPPTIRGSPR